MILGHSNCFPSIFIICKRDVQKFCQHLLQRSVGSVLQFRDREGSALQVNKLRLSWAKLSTIGTELNDNLVIISLNQAMFFTKKKRSFYDISISFSIYSHFIFILF